MDLTTIEAALAALEQVISNFPAQSVISDIVGLVNAFNQVKTALAAVKATQTASK